MSLINVIRGQTVPDSALNVRTPIVRVPLWAALVGVLFRGLFRLVVAYARFWYVTVPTTVLAWLWLRYGWWAPAVLIVVVAVGLTVWFVLGRASFARWVCWPLLSQVRLRWIYRRSWQAAMVTAGEYRIVKIVAVWQDDKGDTYILSPCGRCREFIRQMDESNIETRVILDTDKVVTLAELLPYADWFHKIKER